MWEAVEEAKQLVIQTRDLCQNMKEERLSAEEDFSLVFEQLNTIKDVFNQHEEAIDQEREAWNQHNENLNILIGLFETANADLATERIALRAMAAQYQQQSFRYHIAGAIGGISALVITGVMLFAGPALVQWVRGLFS